jgi:7,8-dihydropterin-6-yl-methyl-4-(beta-D-ribofuranosyl)aminobenzene 5'-phosphate synthase
VAWQAAAPCHGSEEAVGDVKNESESPTGISLEDLRLTVIYDNYPHVEGLRTEWGFSCLVEGAEKLILFDTGGEAPVLLANMDSLSIDPREIDIVVLSHIHEDHTGGLWDFLAVNPDVTVYMPQSFPEDFKKRVTDAGAEAIAVKDPVEICQNAYSVGELGGWIKEQSLALRTNEGVVVITGCAHPGIVPIVERAGEILDDQVLLAMGGFHLLRTGGGDIGDVISDLQELGVAYTAPSHCTGDGARHLFQESFEANYIEMGVGARLAGSSLK